MTVGPRARVALRIGGYVLLALVVFAYALHLTFPYERIRDRLVESLSGTYDVTVSGVDRSLVPGRFALTGVTLVSRPKEAGQPSTTMFFKRVEIDLKLLPLLGKKVELGLDVSTGTGAISGSVTMAGRDMVASFKLRRVPLATLPGITDAVGLPMDGNADGKVSLRLVNGDWSKKSVGSFELGCSVGCAIGDGVTKIYPKAIRPSDAALYRNGLTVPRILVDRFHIAIDLKNGVASRREFEFVSPAGKVEVDFDIKLARQLGNSTISGCIRYQCSQEFIREHPGLCVGSPVVDEQGMMNIKLTATLARMRRMAQRCDTGGGGGGDLGGGAPSRPTLDGVPAAVPDSTTPPPTTTLPTPSEVPTMPPPPPPPPLEKRPMADDVGGAPPPAMAPGMAPPPETPGAYGGSGPMPTPTPGPSGTTAPVTSPGAGSPGAGQFGAPPSEASGAKVP